MMFYVSSDLRPGPDRQGQDRHLRPVRHGAGGEVQEEDEDGAAGAQPGVEREVLLVSIVVFELFSLVPRLKPNGVHGSKQKNG